MKYTEIKAKIPKKYLDIINSDQVAEDFRSRIDFSNHPPCWEWKASADAHGYGQYKRHQNIKKAHRVSYQIFKGPIPPNLTLDHLCGNTKCINPEHLEAVPQGVNSLRSSSPPANNARKTHCKRDHPFNEENTQWVKTKRGTGWSRECKTCKSLRRRNPSIQTILKRMRED